jgi:hypothetical protein
MWRRALGGRQKEGKRGAEGTEVKGMRGVETGQRFFLLADTEMNERALPEKFLRLHHCRAQGASCIMHNARNNITSPGFVPPGKSY